MYLRTLTLVESAFIYTLFAKNRPRLLAQAFGADLFSVLPTPICDQKLKSADHFSVDSPLIESAANHKNFRPRSPAVSPVDYIPGHPTVNFWSEQHRHDTRQSATNLDWVYEKPITRCSDAPECSKLCR